MVKTFYPDDNERKDLYDAFIGTKGCYVIALEGGIFLGYLCDDKNPLEINPNGNAMFCHYLQGDLATFIQFLNPDAGIEYIMFQRNGKGKFRKYPISKFVNLIL